MELMNWVRNRPPATASLIPQRAARTGSMGPRKVITTPVSTKSMCSRAVPPVVTGNFLLTGGPELMIYDECKIKVNASDALHPILRIGRRLSFAAAAVSGGPSAKGLAGERSRPSGIGGSTEQSAGYGRVAVSG